MVTSMRGCTALFCGILLCLPPLAVKAETLPAAPTFEIPFDDVDPVVMQVEISRQLLAFINRLDSHWGKSPQDVRNEVPGMLKWEDRGALVFTRILADHDVLEGYDFQEGMLVRGQYVFLQRPVNGLNEFIDYYTAFKQALTAVYGPPADDRTIWENDLYQPLPDYWGIAVQIGHLRYAANWTTPDGTMSIELTGDHHSRLAIEYRSTAFAEPMKTAFTILLSHPLS